MDIVSRSQLNWYRTIEGHKDISHYQYTFYYNEILYFFKQTYNSAEILSEGSIKILVIFLLFCVIVKNRQKFLSFFSIFELCKVRIMQINPCYLAKYSIYTLTIFFPIFLYWLLSLKKFISTIITLIILTISSPLMANQTAFYQYLFLCLS